MPVTSEDIQAVLQSFNQNAIAARKKLTDIYQDDPQTFLDKCLPTLRGNVDSTGAQFLIAFLLGNGLLEQSVCDPELLNADQAAAVLRVAKRVDPSFEVRLLRELSEASHSAQAFARLLEVLVLSSQSTRLVPILTQMMRHPDPFIQSKAALLMGRLNQNADWVQQRLKDTDIRVRANAVESLWGESSEEARAVFRQAACNSSNRVAGNGLVGLYLAGDPESLQLLLDMYAHPSPLFQATAIWAMGYVGDPRFLPFLADIMGKADDLQRHRIFEAIRRIRHRRDQVASFGSLRVYLFGAARLPDGRRSARFSAYDPVRREVLDGDRLRATHVTVSEEQFTTLKYSVRPCDPPEVMSIGFVLPASAPSGVASEVAGALNDLESVRRSQDIWSQTIYRVPNPEASDSSGTICAHPVAALGKACSSLAALEGSRQLILIGDSEAPFGVSDLSNRIDQARRSGITIHTILQESDAPATLLQAEALSRETGGYPLRFSDLKTLRRHLELILSSLLGPFELTYEMPEDDDSSFPEVRVQIFGPRGIGEAAGLVRPAEFDSEAQPVLIEG